MGTSRWVVNASPLILLGKAGAVELLAQQAEVVVVPAAVVNEIGVRKDGVRLIGALRDHPGFCLPEEELPPSELLAWDLGAGETSVLSYALRTGAERAVLDDLEARRCAKVFGVKAIGTLGVVGRAKRLGLIDLAAPVIERLLKVGLYASDALVARMLAEVGE
jgi:predicted nucleic acid-binding protein